MTFLIKSDKLDALKPDFDKAVAIIKQAVSDKRPIIVRHHDDCDGYTSGYVLEKALRSLYESRPWQYVQRNSCKTPFYGLTDALKDINGYVSKNNEPPLLILTDLGSNDQSLAAINKCLALGFDLIIIDHHRFDQTNASLCKAFINPHTKDFGSDLNAGILCTEIALMLCPDLQDIKHLPALSAIADKSTGEEIDTYIVKSGLDKEILVKWSLVIDHDLFYTRFGENHNFLHYIFTLDKNDMLKSYDAIAKETDKVTVAVQKFVKTTQIQNFTVYEVDKSAVGKHNSYASSKIVRIAQDLGNGPRVTLGYTNEQLSLRAYEVNGFRVIDVVDFLIKEHPYALITGGGHDNAGGIRFNKASKEVIIKSIYTYLRNLK